MAPRLPLLLLMVSQEAWAGLFCTEEKSLDAIHLGAHCIASSGMVGMQCNNAWDGDPSTIWHPATRGVHSYTSVSYPTNVVISKVRILQHHWSMGWADGVNIFINGDKINAKLQHRGHTLNWDEIILEQSYHTALMSVMISSVKNHAFGGIREIQVFGCLPEDALGKLDDWKSLGHIVSLGDILHSKPGDLVPAVPQPTVEDNYEALMNGGHLGIVDEALMNGGHLGIINEQKQDSTTQTVVIQEEITTETVTSVQPTVKEEEPEDTFYDPDDIFGFQEDSSLAEKVYSIGLDDSQSLHDYSGLDEERVSLSSLPTAMAGVLAVVILVVLAGVAGYWYRAGHRYSMSLSVSGEDRDRYLVQEDDLSYFSDSTLRETPPRFLADSRSSRTDSRGTPPRFLADSRSMPVSFLAVSRSAPPSCRGGKTREEGSLLDETKC